MEKHEKEIAAFEQFVNKTSSSVLCNTVLEEMSIYAKQAGQTVHIELWTTAFNSDGVAYKICSHVEVAPDTDITQISIKQY